MSMSSHSEAALFPFPTTTTTTTAHHHHHHRRRARTPSFSSILLDAVYRSIDDDNDNDTIPITNPTPILTTTTTSNENSNYTQHNAKQRRNKMRSDSSTLQTVDLRRTIMIDSWIDNHQDKPQHNHCNNILDQTIHIVRQKSVPAGRSRPSDHSTTSTSTTSSSFSSSKLRAENCFRFDHGPPPAARDSSSRIFTKTKSRAMKIYGELRKPKQPLPPQSQQQQQPISPGGRIAAFLNSIFRNSGGSPARRSNNPATSVSTSTCSSASSFSRSCLSKTPSSRGTKSSGTTKRSVRFYPVSVIVDEDSRPCGQKSLQREDDDVFRKPLISPTNNVIADVNQKQRNWRREKEIDALMTMIRRNCKENVSKFSGGNGDNDEEMNDVDDDDDDDGESCASSDLFELENLSSIGVSRYAEELPVYGTTSLQNLTVA